MKGRVIRISGSPGGAMTARATYSPGGSTPRRICAAKARTLPRATCRASTFTSALPFSASEICSVTLVLPSSA